MNHENRELGIPADPPIRLLSNRSVGKVKLFYRALFRALAFPDNNLCLPNNHLLCLSRDRGTHPGRVYCLFRFI